MPASINAIEHLIMPILLLIARGVAVAGVACITLRRRSDSTQAKVVTSDWTDVITYEPAVEPKPQQSQPKAKRKRPILELFKGFYRALKNDWPQTKDAIDGVIARLIEDQLMRWFVKQLLGRRVAGKISALIQLGGQFMKLLLRALLARGHGALAAT